MSKGDWVLNMMMYSHILATALGVSLGCTAALCGIKDEHCRKFVRIIVAMPFFREFLATVYYSEFYWRAIALSIAECMATFMAIDFLYIGDSIVTRWLFPKIEDDDIK